jgi:PQQ-dependent dehydrogenase (methanol/ethanol family)
MKMNGLSALLIGTALVLTSLPVAAQSDLLENMSPVTDEMIQNPDPGAWLSYRRTLDNQGFSPLEQITKENVGDLQVVWSRGMTEGYQEGTPLVHDGVMFVPHPRDIIQALDATNGDLLWEYKRELPNNVPMIVATRNMAIWDNLIVFSSKDNYLVALDAKTGQLVWETQLRDQDSWAWSTPGPIIVNGKAISGRSCAQQPSGDTPVGGPETCFLTAHDMKTGEEMWRFHTLPHGDMAGSETWNGVDDSLRHHVGSWISPAYDPELNLVYFGTSVTSPYSKFYFANFDSVEDLDAQEFLYQTSTLAIDADTGELKWFQQHLRDHWDLDHPFERVLVNTAIAPNADEVRWINPNVTPGEERRVVTGIPGKTGIFYSMDAGTGEFLWARETVFQNVISDIDTATGRATIPHDMIPTEIGQSMLVCPSASGGRRWFTSTYSPLTNAIYTPLSNNCMQSVTLPNDIRLSPPVMAPGVTNIGTISAISVETGEELWSLDQEDFTTSLLSTQGGLLFGGDTNRRFRAFDQDNGDVLFEAIVPSSVGGVPISYEVDGRQYIAVQVGSWLDIAPFVALSPREVVTGGNAVVVFALPQK